MAGYRHGITVTEIPAVEPLVLSESGIQVAIGTAPIHLAKKPREAVNKIIVCYTLEEVKENLGYSNDLNFTLNEVTFASFEQYKVAPVIFINVLDPEVHYKEVAETELTLTRNGVALPSTSVLLDSVVVKTENDEALVVDEDYTIAYDGLNVPMLYAVKSSTKITQTSKVKVTFNELDPSQVTPSNIVGSFDSETGIATGIELVRKIYPTLSKRPDIIVCPKYSKNPVIASVLEAKTASINTVFNASTYVDIDTTAARKVEDAVKWKDDNYIRDSRTRLCWPMIKRDGMIFHYSAFLAAKRSRMTADDSDGIPYKSPSNEVLFVDDMVLEDGTSVSLELPQANTLNENGIITVLLWASSLRSWGNNTAIYPESKASQNRFIAVRDVMDWWGNTFVERFFDKVDDPTNLRLIESIVDAENMKAAALTAAGKVAGARIVFSREENPVSAIVNGKIKFHTYLAPFSPAEDIENVLEFDPSFIGTALFGGEA